VSDADFDFQPKCIENAPKHPERGISLASLDFCERVDANSRYFGEFPLSDVQHPTPLFYRTSDCLHKSQQIVISRQM
jgi:hypothetical protein